MPQPIISVTLFARDAVTTIERALESVCPQLDDRAELIVLDGGSTDGTQDVVRRYADRIAFFRSAPDGGPTNAINEGVRRARGEVIALLPADDWLEPGALALVAEAFRADPELDVLSCGTRIVTVGADGAVHTEAQFRAPAVLEFTLDNVLRHPLTAGRFIRRRVYERFGGHSAEYALGDYDFLVRVCLGKVKSEVRSELVYTYRRHSRSTTLSGRSDMTLIMMHDNMRLTTAHLSGSGLLGPERRALLRLNAGSSARLAAMLVARGRFGEARQVLANAARFNRLWPLAAIAWFSGSIVSKLRHVHAR